MKSLTKALFISTLLGCGFMLTSSTMISTPSKRAAVGVGSDLLAVKANLTTYDTQLHAFDGLLIQALTLHQTGVLTMGAFNATILDVTGTSSLSLTEAVAIEQSVASIQPILVDICQTITSAPPNSGNPFSTVVTISVSQITALPTGGPIRPNPIRRQIIPISLGSFRTDLISFVNAYKQILNLLEALSPAGVAAEYSTLAIQFASQCQTAGLLAV